MQKELYQIAGKTDSRKIAEFLSKDGQLLLPFLELVCNTEQAVDELIDVVGKPQLMFRASCAPGASQSPKVGKVTDGCFFYRSPLSNRLFMIWSTHISGKGYCVVLTRSESGKLSGPWKEQKFLYTQNGGHGMIFRTFDSRLVMALHQPNSGGEERLHLFGITDNGETLVIDKEVNLQ